MSKRQPTSVNHSENTPHVAHMTSPLVEKLKATGQFLSFSRLSPEDFTQPMQFTLENGTQVSIPHIGVIIFEPVSISSEKDVIYSCGVHGNETAPIEICDELVQQLLKQELTVIHRLMVIFGNLPAMDIAQRFVQENMNRLFDGEHANPAVPNNDERTRARELEASVQQFFESLPADANAVERERHHYDLHTAIRDSKNEKFAVYPFKPSQPHDPAQLGFLGACGVSTILLSEAPTTTFSYHSAKHFNACAFTVELGKVKPFGQNDMSRFVDAKNTIVRFVTDDTFQLPEYHSDNYQVYKIHQVINKQKDDFSLAFDDDTPNFSDFKQGELLAKETGKAYYAEMDGEAIVFPNANVAIGQRALLTVIQTQI